MFFERSLWLDNFVLRSTDLYQDRFPENQIKDQISGISSNKPGCNKLALCRTENTSNLFFGPETLRFIMNGYTKVVEQTGI